MTTYDYFFLAAVVYGLDVNKKECFRLTEVHTRNSKLGLTFPSCCSVRENASMNAWAITDKQPSMCGVFLMSKTN